jgi:hypothetical protein
VRLRPRLQTQQPGELLRQQCQREHDDEVAPIDGAQPSCARCMGTTDVRKRVAAILRARSPTLSAEAARDRAIVVLQLMKAASSLSDEDGLSGRATAQRELRVLTAHYLEQR